MNMYLFKRGISFICSLMLMGNIMATSYVTSAESSNNLISNATFDTNTNSWNTYHTDGGVCTISTVNGSLALDISSIGSLNYSVQLYYDIVPLYKNGVYRIKYDISSTVDRTIDAMIQQNGGTYQAYTSKRLEITSEPQTIDYEFTMKADTDIMSRLVFNCGTYGTDLPQHTIYLDNVSIELVDDTNVDYSGIKNYEPPIVTNQVGYKKDFIKTAVFTGASNEDTFLVVDANTNEIVYTGQLTEEKFDDFSGQYIKTGDFSGLTEDGDYYISCGNLDNSYTFTISNDVYNNLLDDTVRMLYLQRCGTNIEDNIFSHSACHTQFATVYGTDEKIDVSGGWHDAGDYGRYVVTGAKSVADILYAYNNSPELYSDNVGIPESNNGIPDILDEARYEIEWLLKMQNESGGVYHKVTCETFPGYVMPEEETNELIVTPISTTATATFCGTMALAYEVYKNIDENFSNKCLDVAKKAYQFLEENPNFIFENPTDITTGEYGDTSDKDERYWATAQMYRATNDQKYLDDLQNLTLRTGLDSANFGDYGNIAIVTMDNIDTSSDVYIKAKNSIINNADVLVSNANKSPYGLSVTQYYVGGWGSNMTTANQGVILGYAYLLTGDKKYLNSAETNSSYLMGCNPLGICYVTGYGTVSPKNPHHRPSIVLGQAMKGMLVGGVHPYLEDSASKAYCSGLPTGKCYIDNAESFSTNEVTIYWNSSLINLLSFTMKEENSTTEEYSYIDLLKLKKYILGINVDNNLNLDITNDGNINILDIIELKNKLLETL